nr:MAG TPA: hypothetical protein [Caudoviricetes sp.]
MPRQLSGIRFPVLSIAQLASINPEKPPRAAEHHSIRP